MCSKYVIIDAIYSYLAYYTQGVKDEFADWCITISSKYAIIHTVLLFLSIQYFPSKV